MPHSRAADWLRQAEDDAAWLADSIEDGHFAQACYIAQQVAEKALKSLAFFRGASEVKGHSVTKIAQALAINAEIERAGKILDRYYISGRYPDAFPEGIPSDFLDREAALAAQTEALLIFNKVQGAATEIAMTAVIFPPFNDPLQGLSLEEFTYRLRRMLAGRAHSVWLYGSLARGEAHADSDIDLFIVADTDLPFHERGALFDDLRDFNANIELLVYTPSEWERLTSAPTVGFWQSAVREMVPLVNFLAP